MSNMGPQFPAAVFRAVASFAGYGTQGCPPLATDTPNGEDRSAGGYSHSQAPRVLLLTSSLGAGHVRAARAIEAALLQTDPGTQVNTLDFWSLMDKRVAWAVRSAYLRLVREQPALFDHIYRLDQRTWRSILERSEPPPPAFAGVMALMPESDLAPGRMSGPRHASDRLMLPMLASVLSGRHRGGRMVRLCLLQAAWAQLARRLAREVRIFTPDVIVATQMNPAALLSSACHRGGRRISTIGVPTDFGLHDFWIQAGIKHYCVAHETIEGLDQSRIRHDRVGATGIPLMPGFAKPPSPDAARRALGLSCGDPVVLVTGGGLGLGVEQVAARLMSSRVPLRALVVTGHDESTRARVASIAAAHPNRIQVCPWTERIETYIRASDVVVGKPGGLTVAETLACGRPLIASQALGGQEGFNVRFLERQGIGRLVPERDIADAVQALLLDRTALENLQTRAWALGRRDGAQRIANLAHRLAMRGRPAASHGQ